MEKKRIGIIGGGISGTCLGYHLSLYDNAEITVFEKNTIGGASTAKSAGTVCLFDDSLKNRYLRLKNTLSQHKSVGANK